MLLARGSGNERTTSPAPAMGTTGRLDMDVNPPSRSEELERATPPRVVPDPVVQLAPTPEAPEPEALEPDVPAVLVDEEPQRIVAEQPDPVLIEGAPEPAAQPAPEQTPAPVNEPTPSVAEPEVSQPAPMTEPPVTPAPESESPGTPEAQAEPAADDPNAEVPKSADAAPDMPTTPAPAANAPAPDVPAAPVDAPGAPKPEAAAPDAAKPPPVVVRDDGVVMVEGRYAVKGKGTEESPYELPWELLIDIRQVYDPRAGKTVLPEWTKFFEGKVVKITGFLLLPLAGEEVDELLVMRNQWDGCCIGVPPTAYDAVEVKLSGVIRVSRFNVNYGSIVGDFKVDPYLSGKWLIGLYVMDNCLLQDTAGKNLIGT
jgi:hypothetical protein